MNNDFFQNFVVDKLNKLEEDIDEIKTNVTDLCVRTSVMEHDYKNHINTQIQQQDKKYKTAAVMFGCFSAVMAFATFVF